MESISHQDGHNSNLSHDHLFLSTYGIVLIYLLKTIVSVYITVSQYFFVKNQKI